MAFAKINEIENKYQEDKAVIEAKEISDTYTQEMKDAELKELKDTRDADINAVITGYQDMQDNLNGNITPIDHTTIQANTTKYNEELKKITKPTPETLSDDSKTALGELKRTIQHTQYEYLTIFSKYDALLKESNDAKKNMIKTIIQLIVISIQKKMK